MANVITQFLVGIGVKYDENGQKKYEEGMSRMQSGTIRASGIIAATMAAASVVIDRNARNIAQVNLETSRMSAGTQYVLSYGAALQRMGGNAEDAVGNLQKMDQIMDDLHVRGKSDTLNELAQAGFNVAYLTQAHDAPDLQERIANEYQHANTAQRRVASGVLGIDSATANLYAGGGDYLRQQINQAGSLEHVTQELIDKAANYNLQLRDAQTAWNGLVNTATQHYLPVLTKISQASQQAFKWVDQFIQDHPEAADNIAAGATPIIAGGSVSAAAGVATKMGVPGVAGVAKYAGPVGLAAGASIAAEPYIDKGLNSLFGDSKYFQNVRTAQTWGDFGNALIAPFHSGNTYDESNSRSKSESRSIYDNVSLSGMQDVLRGKSVTQGYYNASDMQRLVAESDYEVMAKATTQALQEAPIHVDNHVDAHLHIDGREIDQRIEQYENVQNQHNLNVNSPQVDR